MILRSTALLVHLLQAVISVMGAFYVSAIVAAMMFGAHLYSPSTFRSLFRVNPWLVSGVGTVIWIIVAAVEASPG